MMKLKMLFTMPFLIIRGKSRVSLRHTARFMTRLINSNSRFWILRCKKRVVKMWLGHWSRDTIVPGPRTRSSTWAEATPTAQPSLRLGLLPFPLRACAGTMISSVFVNANTHKRCREPEGFYLKIAFRDGFFLNPELQVFHLPVKRNQNRALK